MTMGTSHSVGLFLLGLMIVWGLCITGCNTHSRYSKPSPAAIPISPLSARPDSTSDSAIPEEPTSTTKRFNRRDFGGSRNEDTNEIVSRPESSEWLTSVGDAAEVSGIGIDKGGEEYVVYHKSGLNTTADDTEVKTDRFGNPVITTSDQVAAIKEHASGVDVPVEQKTKERPITKALADEQVRKPALATDELEISRKPLTISSNSNLAETIEDEAIATLSNPLEQGRIFQDSLKRVEKSVPPRQLLVGSVSGTVTIQVRGRAMTAKDVMIALEPIESSLATKRPPKTHLIDMRGKKYRPRYQHVRVHDTVVFKNGDPFRHNVFSLSSPNKFDLGTHGKNAELTHTFEHPGLVKVYCNIHPSMACFVMVSDSDWVYTTESDGRFQIEEIPPGKYKLTAWNIRGEFNDIVEISADRITSVDIQIDSSRYRKKQHLNKHGKKYPKKVRDEFY